VLLRSLIVKLAADRQLTVDEALVNYLVNRIERSFAAAHAALVRLDEEAMRQHRPVTRALASSCFVSHDSMRRQPPRGTVIH